MIKVPARERLIVALDVDTSDEALALVDRLGDSVEFYKVGWQLFMGTHFKVIQQLAKRNKKVFLDLKIEDIDQTIESAMRNTPDGVEFIELMTLKGASKIIAAAKSGTASRRKPGALGKEPKFLMLTELSSLDDEDMKELYGEQATIEKIVTFKTKKALDADCDGVIASGKSVAMLRDKFGNDFLIVTPGIRPSGQSVDEHKRALTPYQAICYGADYLVVGRPIRDADDPKGQALEIIDEIERGVQRYEDLNNSDGSHRDDFTGLLNTAVGAR